MSALSSAPIRVPHAVDPCDCDDEAEPVTVSTTQEELEAFYIVRALLRSVVNCRRITMCDCNTECGVLLDGDEAKRICGFNFNGDSLQFVVFERGEPQTYPLDGVNDIYDYAFPLRDVVAHYERTMPWKHRVLDREVLA